jgi:transcriptional regulator with XRE-family HTH domain
MADRIGVARSTYSKMENGDFSVSAETLILTMQALGLLEKFEEFINPYNSDIGRMQAGKLLAKRIRH